MKVYEIYTSPVGGIEAVKKGWSWPGFFFTWIWAFVKKLNKLGFWVLVGAIISCIHPAVSMIYGIIVILWTGSNGNDKWRTGLRSRGYEQVATYTAENPDGAIALFVQEQKSLKQQHADEKQAGKAHESQLPDSTSKLINCPDCDKAVSRKAASCPNCGCPISPNSIDE